MTVVQEKPVASRLPPLLRQYLEEQAKLGFRSLSSEIAMRLERTRQADQRLLPNPDKGAA